MPLVLPNAPNMLFQWLTLAQEWIASTSCTKKALWIIISPISMKDKDNNNEETFTHQSPNYVFFRITFSYHEKGAFKKYIRWGGWWGGTPKRTRANNGRRESKLGNLERKYFLNVPKHNQSHVSLNYITNLTRFYSRVGKFLNFI